MTFGQMIVALKWIGIAANSHINLFPFVIVNIIVKEDIKHYHFKSAQASQIWYKNKLLSLKTNSELRRIQSWRKVNTNFMYTSLKRVGVEASPHIFTNHKNYLLFLLTKWYLILDTVVNCSKNNGFYFPYLFLQKLVKA